MEDLVLSCLESRVETNRNLYARFLVGPFLKGDALTVATALRRVLLSSVESIGITALYIQGITHEFSTIPGVRESVLELSLNFRAIVLCYEKPFFQKKRFFDDTQIGYLQVQGPRVVYANDLKLPLGIRLVDPTQYIATISKEGSIVLKFVIGKKNNLLRAVQANPLSFAQQSKTKQSKAVQPIQPTSFQVTSQTNKSVLLERASSFFSTNQARPFQKSKLILEKKQSSLQIQDWLQSRAQAKPNLDPQFNFSIKKVKAPLPRKQSIYFPIIGEQIKKNITRVKKRYSYKNCLKKNSSRTRTWFTGASTFQFSIFTHTNFSLMKSILWYEIEKNGSYLFAPFCTFFLGHTIQGVSRKTGGRKQFCFAKPLKKDQKHPALLQKSIPFPFCYNFKLARPFTEKRGIALDFAMQKPEVPLLKERKLSKCSPLVSSYWSCKQKQLFIDCRNALQNPALQYFAPRVRAHSGNSTCQFSIGKQLPEWARTREILLRKTSFQYPCRACPSINRGARNGKFKAAGGIANKICTPIYSNLQSKTNKIGVPPSAYSIGIDVQGKRAKTNFRTAWDYANTRRPKRQASIFKKRGEDTKKRLAGHEIAWHAKTVKTKLCAHNFEPPVEQPKLHFLKSSKESTFLRKNKVFKSDICLRNIIPLDSAVSPVLKVNFAIEIDDEVLYLRQKIRERIILEVWTNGSIHPRQAVHNGAISLTDMFASFRSVYRVKSYFLPLFKIKQSNKTSKNLKGDSFLIPERGNFCFSKT